MNINDFAYIVETSKSFDETVISVLRAVEKKGWSIFQIYDVKERLAAKGFSQPPLKIIEFCSAKHANNFLAKNKLISLCMPCKINVLEDDGQVKIVGMKSSVLPYFFPEIKKEETELVEKEVKEIIDNAK